MSTFFAWVQQTWWHWPVAYAAGYVAYVTTAILIWGFIYRPCVAVGGEFPFKRGKPWNADDVVIFAFLQGIGWPLMIGVYALFLGVKLLKDTLQFIVEGADRVANQVVKGIPDNRPAGFQAKQLTLVKSLLADNKPASTTPTLSRVERGR